MRVFFIFIALFLLPLFSYGALDLSIPMGKKARLRFAESRMDAGERKNVLVALAEIPEGSLISIPELRPQMFQWVLNDSGKIIQSTMPYFVIRVIQIAEPNDIPAEVKTRILAEPFYVHIRDMNAGLIVSRLFPESLPSGVEKIEGNFLWNEFNPNGTWAHAIRLGLEKTLNSHLLREAPRDIVDFCPRYFSLSQLDKEKFWIALLNEIGKFESAFIPHTASDEGRYDPGSKGVISSGITQISIRSSKQECYQARGCQAIRNQEDLYHPERNLTCAIGIMSCLAERDNCVSCKSGNWKGIARYWSTLRDPYEVNCSICPGGKITIGKKPAIKESLKQTASFCH